MPISCAITIAEITLRMGYLRHRKPDVESVAAKPGLDFNAWRALVASNLIAGFALSSTWTIDAGVGVVADGSASPLVRNLQSIQSWLAGRPAALQSPHRVRCANLTLHEQ